jgi:hypothetical protein
LLAKFPLGTSCRDYYPVGTEVPRDLLPRGLLGQEPDTRHTQHRAMRQYARGKAVERPKAPEQPPALETSQEPPGEPGGALLAGVERDEEVARLWSTTNYTQAQIAALVGAPVNTVASILQRLREKGDPRAAPRKHRPAGHKSRMPYGSARN